MKSPITIETSIVVIKYAIVPIACWPPAIGSSNRTTLWNKLWFWIGFICGNLTINIESSLYNVYKHAHDVDRIIKILTEACALTFTWVKMIICKRQASCLQALIAGMDTFLKGASRQEKDLIQSYVDKCVYAHAMVSASCIIGPLAFIVGPLITSQIFPGDVASLFVIESTWLWLFLYLSQILSISQVGSMVILDLLFTVLLCYAGARFQLLSIEFKKATNTDELKRCARVHQELIRGQTKECNEHHGCRVTTIAVFAVIAGGFELIRSEEIGDAVYGCNWVGKSSAMRKDVMIILHRVRCSIVISVRGVIPVLSLEFYGSTMSAAFSYLTNVTGSS